MILEIAFAISLIALLHLSKPGKYFVDKITKRYLDTENEFMRTFYKMLLCPGCFSFWMILLVHFAMPYLSMTLVAMLIGSAIVHIALAVYYELLQQ